VRPAARDRHPLALAAGSVLDARAVDVCDVAAAAGFDAIGLRLSGEHAVARRDVVPLRRRIEDAGLVLLDAEVHRIAPGTAAPGELIDTAAALGARHLLVVSDLDDASRTRDALAAVVERCRDAGIGTALEYMAWTTPSTPAGALALAEATGASVVVDLLHHTRVGATVAELARLVRSGRVGWVQICDAGDRPADGDLVHEARHARRAPGDGILPLAELLAVVPFGVPLSVEVQSDLLRTTLPPDRRALLLHGRAQPLNTIGYRPK